MSGMDQMLAGYFGTGGVEPQASAEDAEKIAQVELFTKVAADMHAKGLAPSLDEMSSAQVEWLWSRTFSKEAEAAPAGQPAPETKVAEFPPPKKEGGEDDEKKDREEKARKEHEEKKAAAERFDQAVYFGKTAAHSYVAEMKNIITAGGLDFMKEGGVRETAGKALNAVGNATGVNQLREAHRLHKKLGPEGRGVGEATRHLHEEGRSSNLRQGAMRAGATAAGTAAAGAGAHHATKEKKGSAELSAFELEAAELAFAKVAAAEFDQEQAVRRLNAVLELGLDPSEKVASLVVNGSYEETLERRSLEYAAAAGYPVEWAQ